MESDNKPNLIVDLSFEFALAIIKYAELLDTNRKYIISKQLLRSGTSIGANIKEAQSAESRNDFIHKMKIAAKEAEETEYWLLLCKSSEGYPNCEDLSNKCISIKKVLSKIIASSKSAH
ncbi:MAG: four helix bundle protein [Bacteroidota bacterium]